MKRIIACLLAAVFCFCAVISVSADNTFIYEGNAQDFIYVHEPVDEEGNLIRVMPGDHAERDMTVVNDISRGVKVNIYVRPLVKVVKAGSGVTEYIPEVGVVVEKSQDNRMAYMFNTANQQLDENSEWLLLGTLYSGGEVNLDLFLDFPITLGNEYQDADFYLEFRIQEFPTEPDDPQPPQTGDTAMTVIFSCTAAVAIVLVLIPIVARRRRRADDEE